VTHLIVTFVSHLSLSSPVHCFMLFLWCDSFCFFVFFFFQAEDGIRDFHVTGVQTCALPISRSRNWAAPSPSGAPGTGACCSRRAHTRTARLPAAGPPARQPGSGRATHRLRFNAFC